MECCSAGSCAALEAALPHPHASRFEIASLKFRRSRIAAGGAGAAWAQECSGGLRPGSALDTDTEVRKRSEALSGPWAGGAGSADRPRVGLRRHFHGLLDCAEQLLVPRLELAVPQPAFQKARLGVRCSARLAAVLIEARQVDGLLQPHGR